MSLPDSTHASGESAGCFPVFAVEITSQSLAGRSRDATMQPRRNSNLRTPPLPAATSIATSASATLAADSFVQSIHGKNSAPAESFSSKRKRASGEPAGPGSGASSGDSGDPLALAVSDAMLSEEITRQVTAGELGHLPSLLDQLAHVRARLEIAYGCDLAVRARWLFEELRDAYRRQGWVPPHIKCGSAAYDGSNSAFASSSSSSSSTFHSAATRVPASSHSKSHNSSTGWASDDAIVLIDSDDDGDDDVCDDWASIWRSLGWGNLHAASQFYGGIDDKDDDEDAFDDIDESDQDENNNFDVGSSSSSSNALGRRYTHPMVTRRQLRLQQRRSGSSSSQAYVDTSFSAAPTNCIDLVAMESSDGNAPNKITKLESNPSVHHRQDPRRPRDAGRDDCEDETIDLSVPLGPVLASASIAAVAIPPCASAFQSVVTLSTRALTTAPLTETCSLAIASAALNTARQRNDDESIEDSHASSRRNMVGCGESIVGYIGGFKGAENTRTVSNRMHRASLPRHGGRASCQSDVGRNGAPVQKVSRFRAVACAITDEVMNHCTHESTRFQC